MILADIRTQTVKFYVDAKVFLRCTMYMFRPTHLFLRHTGILHVIVLFLP